MLSRITVTSFRPMARGLLSGRGMKLTGVQLARPFSTPTTQRAAVVHVAGDADQLKIETAWPVPEIGEWFLSLLRSSIPPNSHGFSSNPGTS